MNKIRVLPPHLANQIAAGEVVERPASIVKELVENAIDAGASAVTVSLHEGGLSSILVTDNGSGISPEDAPNAFLRHATSKISSAEDLDAINSLGFRGEALASIGSVAVVTMLTRTKDSDTGTKIVFDNGQMLTNQESACVFGTSIRVENLFAKVPARLKFLKSARTEAGYCGDYMTRMILCRPDIAFRFLHNDKVVYETYGDGKLKSAVFALYGSAVAEKLCRVEFDNGYMKLEGYIGNQEISRPNRSMESLFVNGRYIRSMALNNAIERAYDTRMMVGRYPFAALHLTISSREVDVNVHPAKTQVRFADEARVAYGFTSACARALRSKVVPQMKLPISGKPENMQETVQKPVNQNAQTVSSSVAHKGDIPSYSSVISSSTQKAGETQKLVKYGIVVPDRNQLKENASMPYRYNNFPVKKEAPEGGIPTFKVESRVESSRKALELEKTEEETKENSSSNNRSHKPVQESLELDMAYKILGCAFNSYWIVEQGDSVFFIDQHAACERRLYEEFSARKTNVSSQELLVTEHLVLQPREFEQAVEYKKELEELGYRFETEGALGLRISAVPVLNGTVFDGAFIHDALNAVGEAGRGAARALVRDKIISASCKHAIKAGEAIDKKEIEELLRLYLRDGTPLTCPHGRPVMVKISRREIEKNFKRIV